MNGSTASVMVEGQEVEYRVRPAKAARKLRIRVSVNGVEVLAPEARGEEEVRAFVEANGPWLVAQLERVTRLRTLRKARQLEAGAILFRGAPTQVAVEDQPRLEGTNRVQRAGGKLVIVIGRRSVTPPVRTLENWLRNQARVAILGHLRVVEEHLNVSPRRVYIMDQRTKWGSCSALQNLSFNWRIIMAPESVMQYLVTHEAVHLAVPDHSHRFWLTVQSLCPEAECGRQWLAANSERLFVDLSEVLRHPSGTARPLTTSIHR